MKTKGPTVRPSDRPTVLSTLPIEFVGSWPDPSTPLDPPLPEVAFVGRSNVGKSSLLNALVGPKGLARVSATPGKTRLMNVFRLPTFYLVDLPGYGYAKARSDAPALGAHPERLSPDQGQPVRPGAGDGCAAPAHRARRDDAQVVPPERPAGPCAAHEGGQALA